MSLAKENSIKISLIHESHARIIIKPVYVPHSLERQIVHAGLNAYPNTKLMKEVLKTDPHSGLDRLSLALSSSVEETIIKSVQENWLIDYQWYQDLLHLLKNPHFS